MSCSEPNCKLPAEYSCECSQRLTCSKHVVMNTEHFGHRVESLFISLDEATAYKITSFVSPILKKLETAMEVCLKHSVQLITQIKANTKLAMGTLCTQTQYFSGLLKKIQGRTVKRNELRVVWNALNNCGVKDLLNLFEFGEEFRLNPLHQNLKKTVTDLAQAGEVLQGFVGRYYEDQNFRESVQFLTDINQYTMKLAYENANKVIERIRINSINSAIRNERVEVRLENQSTVDSFSNTFESSSSYSQEINFEDLSSFFTKEILVNVLKAHLTIGIKENLKEAKSEHIEINSLSELINKVDVVGCLTNQEILNIFIHRLNLIEKCKVVKQFFFLGQGDVFNTFFMKINEGSQFKDHQLLFKESLESNNFKGISKELLSGLNFKEEEEKEEEGETQEIGIYYKFTYPLSVFFTESLVADLQSVFNCLWTLKKVEHDIKTSFKFLSKEIDDIDTILVYEKFFALRFTCIVLINDLLYFLMEEIIEKVWKHLWQKISTCLSFEESVLSFRETINNIKLICGKSTKSSKNLRSLIKTLRAFSNFSQKFLARLQENSLRSSHRKTLQKFPEDLKTALIPFLSTLESLPFENISYFHSRLHEFSFIML